MNEDYFYSSENNFRGYPLEGSKTELPKGYTGLVLDTGVLAFSGNIVTTCWQKLRWYDIYILYPFDLKKKLYIPCGPNKSLGSSL